MIQKSPPIPQIHLENTQILWSQNQSVSPQQISNQFKRPGEMEDWAPNPREEDISDTGEMGENIKQSEN